jgi:L-fuculose-phosphate aldolase
MPAKSLTPILLRTFQQVGRDLFLQGLNSSHSGNLSMTEKDTMWITKRGAPLGRLGARDIVGVPLDDASSKEAVASSELPVHMEIVLRCGAGGIVHAHPPAVIAMSLAEELIVPLDLEGKYHLGEVSVIVSPEPYRPAQVASQVAETLTKSKIVVVRGHGTFARGSDLWEALHWSSALEHSCRIILMSLTLKGRNEKTATKA